MTDPFAQGLPTLDGVARDGGAPRVRLRPTRPDDAEALLGVFSDPDTLRYWTHGPFETVDEAHAYLAGICLLYTSDAADE